MANRLRARTPTRIALGIAVALVALSSAAAAHAETAWTVAGTGAAAVSGDGGQAREAGVHQPRAVSALPGGAVAWAEPYSHRVRIAGGNGVVRTLGGTGEAGYSGDGGPATQAKLNFVHTAAPTADGGFLLADTRNSRIRKISASGIITTVAGNGFWGYTGDGIPARQAQLNNPRSVLPLPDGGFLIPDTDNHRIRRVSAAGIITTVAGTGIRGSGGDGGPAISARLDEPFAVSATADGGFLIVDIGNQRIRKVSAAGIITTVAGTGAAGFSGDGGPATGASLHNPHAVLALPDGGFLIADTANERVRRVSPDGMITTVIGDGARSGSGDGGPAAGARVAAPKGLALTASGDILIADEQSNRIRFVGVPQAPANVQPPTIEGTPAVGKGLEATAGGWAGTGPLISYQWQRCSPGCANLGGATGRGYSPRAADAGTKLRVAVTAANPAGSATAYSAPVTVPGSGSSGGKPSGGSSGSAPGGGTGTGAGRPGSAGGGGSTPGSRLRWVVSVRVGSLVVGEYVVRQRSLPVSGAIRAYGTPRCKARGAKRASVSWARRGIAIDARSARPLRRGTPACARATSLYVSTLRLTDRRWVTSLGLRVGDGTARLRKLYPRARNSGGASARQGRYLLASRCPARCTSAGRQSLVAHVARGRVTALVLTVGPIGR